MDPQYALEQLALYEMNSEKFIKHKNKEKELKIAINSVAQTTNML